MSRSRRIGDQFGGIRADAIHRIQSLEAVGHVAAEGIELAAAEKFAAAVCLGTHLGEGVVGHRR
jgi:hypothetical protein